MSSSSPLAFSFSFFILAIYIIARSLIEMGEAMKELSEVKYSLEDNVKQNFLEPLTHLQAKDLKDVMVSWGDLLQLSF